MPILSRSIRELNALDLLGEPAATFRPTAAPALARRSHATRVLHLALLLIVAHQLVGSQFMERPLPGEDAETPFRLHEWIGMAGFAIIALFWMWTLVRDRSETPLARLVPWFSAVGDLLALRAPGDHGGALSGAVHGLGLLLVSAMAATGAAWFVFDGTSLGRATIGLHATLANLAWVYLVGHAGMAAFHAAIGDGVAARMFWSRRGGANGGARS